MQFQGEHIHIKTLYSPYEFVYPSEKIYVLKKVLWSRRLIKAAKSALYNRYELKAAGACFRNTYIFPLGITQFYVDAYF